jgi:hypothetical protein
MTVTIVGVGEVAKDQHSDRQGTAMARHEGELGRCNVLVASTSDDDGGLLTKQRSPSR